MTIAVVDLALTRHDARCALDAFPARLPAVFDGLPRLGNSFRQLGQRRVFPDSLLSQVFEFVPPENLVERLFCFRLVEFGGNV